jgi:hypothetical protein
MSRSDPTARPDWRGWLALAWVAWFGLLYGRTVVAQRAAKLRAAVARPAPPVSAHTGGATRVP